MNSDIKNAILEGRLMLLLGAGASFGSKTRAGQDIPLGDELARIIAEKSGFEYTNEKLPQVYSACSEILGQEMNNLFDNYFNFCKPSPEYMVLSKYIFRRIYTLNIDDALDKALSLNSKQNVYVKRRNDKVSPPDQLFKNLDLVKLNGDIKNQSEGYIFSPQEYGNASAFSPLWYNELGGDFYNFKFLFIGTGLNEPLFFHQIERYKGKTSSSEQRSYLITPSVTEINKRSLLQSNIEHIAGTLKSFTDWLQKEIPIPVSSNDILKSSRPEYNVSILDNESKYLEIFRNVLPVSRSSLQILKERDSGNPIRNFYKGFKPTWRDILDNVPAELNNLWVILNEIIDIIRNNKCINLYCIFGSAGSGKTTLLKQLALKISDKNIPTYFIDNINANIKDLIIELENKNNSRYIIFVERIADSAQILGEIFNENRISKGLIVGSESKNIWTYRGKEYFSTYETKDISQITRSDANKILEKISIYGNWTRLEKFTQKERVDEIIKKSRKQLLIGLMESTLGEGYNQIIKEDYEKIPSESHRALLVLSGIASYQRTDAHESTLTRALQELKLDANVYQLIKQMDGILFYKNGFVEARHYAYIERIFSKFLDSDYLFNLISAYISAFTVYDYPIVTNVIKSEAAIYKSLVNAKNIKKLLKNEKEKVLNLYNKFEKKLEHEGLYLMQYGIALRDFSEYPQAYEKLKIANEAYPNSPQIEHAFAQMKLIMALECNDEIEAFVLFKEAEEILLRLDGGKVKIIDGYPIVALSEGHLNIVLKYHGDIEARKIASYYFDKINKLYNNDVSKDKRIENTSQMLFKYATTGIKDKGLEYKYSTNE
ncbi:SIR2 family protein [Morganella morganii]|uniref:P-loop NTPase n=1 Tax=Morganella morganii TaxID=582 RepID=UPI0021CEE461|nr:SIR2 family protein [Morganella morganii]MCU6376820.1 SIR2 family protein [Morganella morganii]